MGIRKIINSLIMLPYEIQYANNRLTLENEARRQLEIERIKKEIKSSTQKN